MKLLRKLIDLNDGTFLVPLTKGCYSRIDAIDVEVVGQYNWTVTKHKKHFSAYASLKKDNGRYTCVLMHRMILGLKDPAVVVDHKNGDSLDNRRQNLRVCNQTQNMWNQRKQTRPTSSKYKGVYYYKRDGVWVANIKANQKLYYLGRYKTEEKAAKAYDTKAVELFGEFACLNFPEDHGTG